MTLKELLVRWTRRLLPYPTPETVQTTWPEEFAAAVEQNFLELETSLSATERRLRNISQEFGLFPVGDAVAAGDLCVLSTNGEMIPASAIDKTYASGLVALATETAGPTQEARFLLWGFVNDTVFTPGDLLYMDTVQGNITPTQPSLTGQVVRLVGYKLANDKIFFKPDETFIEIE